jgi:hypothetical protein
MSLFIVTEAFGHTQELEWVLGASVKDIKVSLIREVQADGVELIYINGRMPNVPTVLDKKSVTWFGDMAKFIAVNIGAVDLDD